MRIRRLESECRAMVDFRIHSDLLPSISNEQDIFSISLLFVKKWLYIKKYFWWQFKRTSLIESVKVELVFRIKYKLPAFMNSRIIQGDPFKREYRNNPSTSSFKKDFWEGSYAI